MRANTWAGRNKVEVREVPDPSILNSRDAIVRVTSTAVCGSDLHLLDGYVPAMRDGDVLGHEFCGRPSCRAAAAASCRSSGCTAG
ncbi:alcohol dehydrogenase catalytic domain-containing protein [Sphaerisporangium sp. B11E5]|uniref:alcohol dehydrogenase catalytic domain-containing protein n=1 Tax=Sphaerisporangium sp. B11E5 TaxID=3153563 RepID=UPI00325F29F7